VQVILVANVETGSPAWQAGLRQGDLVTGVNRSRVSDLSAFHRQVLINASDLTLHVQRGESSVFILIR